MSANSIDSTPEFVGDIYARMERNLAVVRRRLGRPLNLAEKVLLSHLDDPESQELAAGVGSAEEDLHGAVFDTRAVEDG